MRYYAYDIAAAAPDMRCFADAATDIYYAMIILLLFFSLICRFRCCATPLLAIFWFRFRYTPLPYADATYAHALQIFALFICHSTTTPAVLPCFRCRLIVAADDAAPASPRALLFSDTVRLRMPSRHRRADAYVAMI